MDDIETISEHLRNSLVELANELAEEVPTAEEELKHPLVAYSMLDAAATYIACMMKDTYKHTELKNNKEDLLLEFQSYFNEALNYQFSFALFDSAISDKPKDNKCHVVNLADYLAKRQ